jgi:hypothetical protein
MQPLDKQLRSKLENTIKEARDIAEDGALAALQQLGVGQATPDAHLSEAERDLRRRLRAHGRQLGDVRRSEGTQELARLAEEVAYEHWHRMLFARFLAENDLLMYPDPDEPVAVSLEECEEMAADEGVRNGWELAARYASKMLPQIFRPDSPSFELELPPEYERKLENLLAGLSAEVFQASDALGWVYQFWQAKRKEQVNKSEVKIGARELPAVTQLFTEPYMVSFLLDNSLGAWWVKQLAVDSGQLADEARRKLQTAATEEELREFFCREGMPLDYLRFIKTDHCELKTDNSSVFRGEHWQPASGWFDGWPEKLSELKTLDPCCGSGHFLVAAFLMLVPMRMERESLSAREAVDAVLRDNLHGLEIDPRCVEIAAFALALTAWRFPEAGGYRPLPTLQVACSGLSISVAKEEWAQLPLEKADQRLMMNWLYDLFAKAPVLGSLIDPKRSETALYAEWPDLQQALNRCLQPGQADAQRELGIVAQGLTKAAQLLSEKYNFVLTNVPYLARGKQDDVLREFCEKHPGKNDLATVFLDRCLEFCSDGGTANVVLPQNWLFLTSYRKFREKLLREETWNLVARMGEGGFESSAAAGAFTILLTISRGNQAEFTLGEASQSGHRLRGLDVSAPRTAAEKADQLHTAEIKSVEQAKQLENPDARVSFDEVGGELLESYAAGINGMHGADSLRFRFCFWEVTDFRTWNFFQCTHEDTEHFGGKSNVFYWANNGKLHRENPKAFVKGEKTWGKPGVVVSMMRELPVTLYSGDKFDISCTPIIPQDPTHLPAIWCFCSSPEYNEAVRQIDQALKVTNATLVKVPFDLEHWTKVAEAQYPNGLPKPYSDDPTQWIFHGHPVGSDDPLQVAVARLLGYQWPAELDSEMELSDEARAKVAESKKLLPFADEDGIVCIPAVRGEASAADRLLNLLAAAYGGAWSNATLGQLLTQADHAGKPLETWLRDRFFAQHAKRFQHRPFIWHIWDGLRDGFAALVNYHTFDAKALETLIYTYLGDWIARQKEDIRNGVDGAQEKLAAAENLKKRLELIQQGEPPYDIFVRWKPLEEQPLGWNPDLNDGVRLNIRPFMTAEVLRENKKPRLNIEWKKDRGKDVASAPWFPLFGGDRINDHHLTRAEKEAARKERTL